MIPEPSNPHKRGGDYPILENGTRRSNEVPKDWKEVHVETIKFKERLMLKAPPDEDYNEEVKREIVRRQLMDHLSGHLVACAACRTEWQIYSLYRCRLCGVWYCGKCADIHFAADKPA